MVKYVYDAWGNHSVTALDSAYTELSQLNPYRYRGYYYDVETGLYYLKTRYYDPEVGRFVTIDGIAYLDRYIINGLNLYAYCTNNPVSYIDPNGTGRVADWIKEKWAQLKSLFIKGAKLVGGFFLAEIGLLITIATLPIAIFVPGGGFLTQAGFSMTMYGDFMMASVFDSQINADMNAINWNPFNSDINKVLNSSKVSFYQGLPVVWTNHRNGRSGSFLGIWLTGYNDTDTIRHEWGHGIQQGIMGVVRFLTMIGLPSAGEWGKSKWGTSDYYIRPWEASADMFGGVAPRSGFFNARTAADEHRARWYMAISMLFGLFGYLFII